MSTTFASRFVHNWARLKYTGEADLPTREFVGKELLFKSKLVSAKDIYSFIALPNRREFELCFFQETTLRRFLEQYASEIEEEKWKYWSIESSVSISVVNVVVKFWTGRVSDHDVELYLKRYCNLLEKPYKPVDSFGIWYGVRKYKVEIKLDTNGKRMCLPSSISLGPYNGRVFYPGQETRCFVCSSTEHQVRECKEVKCWKCSGLGHKAKDCQNSAVCSLCGELGHSYFQCPKSYSNKAKEQRKEQATEQQRRVVELLRSSRQQVPPSYYNSMVPPPDDASTPQSADSGQQSRPQLEPSATTPTPTEERSEAGMSAETGRKEPDPGNFRPISILSSLSMLVPGRGRRTQLEPGATTPTPRGERGEAGTTAETKVSQQLVPGRGRGRGRSTFSAANMRAAAARSGGAIFQMVGQQQQSPPPSCPEAAAAEETEEAVRQLEDAVKNILPPWSDSSGVEEEKGAEDDEQRDEEKGEESDYDSASEEPSEPSDSTPGSSLVSGGGEGLLPDAADGTRGEGAEHHVSVNGQKRQTSPLANVEKKHKQR